MANMAVAYVQWEGLEPGQGLSLQVLALLC